MQDKTRAVVLDYIKYGDSSIIVSMYTEKYGRQSFLVNGVKGKKAKFRLNHFQPLYLLNLEVAFKPGRELQRIRDLRIEFPFHSIPYDIVKSTQAMFLAEMLGKSLRETEQNQHLFEFIYHSISFLDELEQGKSNFHILFLLQLTRFLGFFPNNNYREGFFFDLINGCFTDHPPVESATILNKEESKILFRILETSFRDLHTLHLSGQQREIILERIIRYYSLHLESVSKIKSLSILHDIFK